MNDAWPFLAGIGVGVVLTIAAIGVIAVIAYNRKTSKEKEIL